MLFTFFLRLLRIRGGVGSTVGNGGASVRSTVGNGASVGSTIGNIKVTDDGASVGTLIQNYGTLRKYTP